MSVDQTEVLAKRGISRVQDAAEGVVDDVTSLARGRLNEATGAAHDAYEATRDSIYDLVDDLRDHLRDRPLLTVGIGVLVGLTLRSALRRRHPAN